MKSYQVITDRIVSLLEEGTVPWHKPWKGGPAGHPRSLSTGKPYRGVNVFMLHAAGYSSPHWLTFKHAQAMGGHLPGERIHRALRVQHARHISDPHPDDRRYPLG